MKLWIWYQCMDQIFSSHRATHLKFVFLFRWLIFLFLWNFSCYLASFALHTLLMCSLPNCVKTAQMNGFWSYTMVILLRILLLYHTSILTSMSLIVCIFSPHNYCYLSQYHFLVSISILVAHKVEIQPVVHLKQKYFLPFCYVLPLVSIHLFMVIRFHLLQNFDNPIYYL